MKVILRSSSLPLTLLGILTNVGVARVDTGLRRGMAGRVRIGMRLEDLESEPGISFTAAPDVPEVGVFLGAARESEPALIAEFSSGVLSRCRVLSGDTVPRPESGSAPRLPIYSGLIRWCGRKRAWRWWSRSKCGLRSGTEELSRF